MLRTHVLLQSYVFREEQNGAAWGAFNTSDAQLEIEKHVERNVF
jgi:hypothetical protein